MYMLDVCSSSGILKIFAFLKIIINFIFIIVAIGLIIMVSIDFAKAIISGDADAQKKSIELGFNRILYAIFLFAVPYMVSVVVTILDNMGSDYARCLELAGDPKVIAQLEIQENNMKEAKYSAEEAARDAKKEHILEMNEKKQMAFTVENKSQGEGCDGVIYYENGIFYKPSSALVPKNGIDKTKGSAVYGYNKYFYDALTKFVEAAKKDGHTITPSDTEYGAWRSYENQEHFWYCYQTGTCNNGNLAAYPGTSNHGWAIASDLSFGDTNSLYLAHDHANEYNLSFPLCNNVRTGACVENWHIEPLSIIEDDERAKACI